ncbi:MAG: prepilin-type N-terminal cleavage/methylation domain-containing protein [Planctomycetota bacterium]
MSRSIARRGFTLTELLVALTLFALLATLLMPAFMKTRCVERRGRCVTTLRQLALAAMQYADDKKFTPHFGPTKVLDGDDQTNHATKATRALVYYGYHDNPEGFVCRSSVDMYVPITNNEVRENMRLWMWTNPGPGGLADPDASPWLRGADPALAVTEELSYGYTRRGYNRNASSLELLGADRGVRIVKDGEDPGAVGAGDYGNHPEGWNVSHVDASVEFIPCDYDFGDPQTPSPGSFLRGTGKGQGSLAISRVADPKNR